jgi:hypothetical protein
MGLEEVARREAAEGIHGEIILKKLKAVEVEMEKSNMLCEIEIKRNARACTSNARFLFINKA